jgi:hypothetical protein
MNDSESVLMPAIHQKFSAEKNTTTVSTVFVRYLKIPVIIDILQGKNVATRISKSANLKS